MLFTLKYGLPQFCSSIEKNLCLLLSSVQDSQHSKKIDNK
jgi:hypothetical protein